MELLPGEIRDEIRKYLSLQERGRLVRCCNFLNNEDNAIKIWDELKFTVKEDSVERYRDIWRNFCSNWVKVINTKKLPYELETIGLFMSANFPFTNWSVKLCFRKICHVFNRHENMIHSPVHKCQILWEPTKCSIQILTPTACECEKFYNEKINKFEAKTLEELYQKYGKIINGKWANYKYITRVYNKLKM